MALSKPVAKGVHECLNRVSWDQNVKSEIGFEATMEVCKIAYDRAMSVEIIDHLLGGQNMEYAPMELQNSFDCFSVCYKIYWKIYVKTSRRFSSLKIARVEPLIFL